MIDRNGFEVAVGDRVRVYVGRSTAPRPGTTWRGWRMGTVRWVGSDSALVDDGRPADPNPFTSGATFTLGVASGRLEWDRGGVL